MTPSPAEKIRFYGRRKGRPLSQNMQRLLDSRLPEVAIPEQLDRNWLKQRLFLHESTEAPADLVLEIGFGGGEHLAAIAAAEPAKLFIGAEPFVNGVVSLLRHIENQVLRNICIWPDDVRLMLGQLPKNSLSCVYVMFPDPWPKVRHARRRILNPEMLNCLAGLLRPKGLLRMASDHPIAKSWLLAEAVRHPNFEWRARCAEDWRARPQGWPQTRYMRKGLSEGRLPSWFEFERR